ncbi:dipeptide ABC transporter ATP-binding protein [Luteococcus peritonei]
MLLRDLTVHFDGQEEPAAQGITLHVVPGRILALVGESGSGKSVTAMGSIGLLPTTARVSGSAQLDGTELVGAPRRLLDQVRGAQVGTIFQEPTTALDPLQTIGDALAEAIAAHSPHRARRRRLDDRVHRLLARVELPDVERMARSYPHQLSGGQLQRACIALALASEPDVLIADEPTTALDVTVQAGILDLLRSLADDGLAILLITHDMGVVADVADEVAVMRAGRVVEQAEVHELFAHPQQAYTRQLLGAVPKLEAATTTSRPREPEPGKTLDDLVVVQDLDVVYRTRRRKEVHAVQGVSFRIGRGEVVGLVGESGSGKSTIAQTLAGLVPASRGSVVVDGTQLVGTSQQGLLDVRRRLGVVFQNPASALNPRRTIAQSIAEPLRLHSDLSPEQRRQRVVSLLDQVQLPSAMADRYPHEASGGQRQRVAIARALALRPDLVIADEPTSALDVSVQAVVLELLDELQREYGFSCLFVSHDLAVVEQVAARTVVLNQGRVVEQGPTRLVLSEPDDDYTRRLVAAVPVPDPVIQQARRTARAA